MNQDSRDANEQYEGFLHDYDRRPLTAPPIGITAPVIEKSILDAARLWASLFPNASAEKRLKFVTEFAALVGVCVV